MKITKDGVEVTVNFRQQTNKSHLENVLAKRTAIMCAYKKQIKNLEEKNERLERRLERAKNFLLYD